MPTLQYFGLTDKEAKIYLALLQAGEQTAYSIALKSQLKKPTTYVILEELVRRGIVNKISRASSTRYEAVDPVELFVRARRLAEQAEASLPELRALYQSDRARVKASFYEGLDGIKHMFKQLIEHSRGQEQVAFYAHQKDTPKALQEYWKELNQEYKENGVTRRAITTLDPSIKDYLTQGIVTEEFLKLKALPPKKYSSNISIDIFGSYTQIISHRYLQGVLIENPDIANVMKQIFELVWTGKK